MNNWRLKAKEKKEKKENILTPEQVEANQKAATKKQKEAEKMKPFLLRKGFCFILSEQFPVS